MTDYICSPEMCKGCGLCQNICPIGCITLEYNVEGFLNPVRNMELCTRCGLCSDWCITQRNSLQSSCDSAVYCTQSCDEENLSNCTSGGFFGELARIIIEKKAGVVYGAVYDDTYHVKHARAETILETLPMHYSKYVQSDTSQVYKEVKKDLKDRRIVLFTGTPCQIVALKCFLNREYENLLCMDVLCHGVMSTTVLRDYIRYILPSEEGLEHIEVCFRSKKIPHSKSSFVLSKDGQILHHEPFHDSKEGIGRAFGGMIVNRVSCTNCEFRVLGRYSDITAGDYVEENVYNDFTHSLILVNTEKGQEFFDQLPIKKQLLTGGEREFSLKRVQRKVIQNKQRNHFFKLYTQKGINETITALWRRRSPSVWRRICARCSKLLRKR